MSGLETAVLLDANALENLYTAGKEAAWDQLIIRGRKLIVPEEVLDEIRRIDTENPNSPNVGLRAKFDKTVT
jgi:hypothetical protein